MDDLQAVEQRIANEMVRRAGPRRPVDDLATYRAVSQTRRWSLGPMFSATKLVVAGAIVALFGGLLLAGFLTQPNDELMPAGVTDSPDATVELLSGVDLVTEEVEPGVHRVERAGSHWLVDDPKSVAMWVAGDGSVVRAQLDRDRSSLAELRPGGRLFTLGGDSRSLPRETEHVGERGLVVDADGIIWLSLEDIWSYDPSSTRPAWRLDGSFGADGRQPRSLAIGPEGDLWAVWSPGRDGSSSRRIGISRLADDGWEDLPVPDGFEASAPLYTGAFSFAVDAQGTPWLAGIRRGATNDPGWELPVDGLLRFDGSAWELVDPVASGPYEVYANLVAAGRDGSVWATFRDADEGKGYLARLADGDWTVLSTVDGVPDSTARIGQGNVDGLLEVAPDGSVWMTAASSAGPDEMANEGIARFDGETWQHYLMDRWIRTLAISPKGRAWVVTDEGTYVIDTRVGVE